MNLKDSSMKQSQHMSKIFVPVVRKKQLRLQYNPIQYHGEKYVYYDDTNVETIEKKDCDMDPTPQIHEL